MKLPGKPVERGTIISPKEDRLRRFFRKWTVFAFGLIVADRGFWVDRTNAFGALEQHSELI
jgi:hypothetical protein